MNIFRAGRSRIFYATQLFSLFTTSSLISPIIDHLMQRWVVRKVARVTGKWLRLMIAVQEVLITIKCIQLVWAGEVENAFHACFHDFLALRPSRSTQPS